MDYIMVMGETERNGKDALLARDSLRLSAMTTLRPDLR
jgi:hypothetical protein